MAKKRERVIHVEQPSEAPAGADDLQIMNPNHTLTLAGVSVTVREYGFIEGLQLRAAVQPLLDDLYAVLAADKPIELEDCLQILSNHWQTTQALLAKAADVEPQWLEGLSQDEGLALMYTWWTVNGPFYLRSVMQRRAQELRAAHLRDGRTSTQPSPPPDTEHPAS